MSSIKLSRFVVYRFRCEVRVFFTVAIVPILRQFGLSAEAKKTGKPSGVEEIWLNCFFVFYVFRVPLLPSEANLVRYKTPIHGVFSPNARFSIKDKFDSLKKRSPF